MKEKEVRLTSEEIDYLLKGTIHWEDVSSRVDGTLRKPIDKAPKKDFGLERKEDIEDPFEVDLFEEDHPFWSGTKVYILLSLMGCITLVTWAYFVFA